MMMSAALANTQAVRRPLGMGRQARWAIGAACAALLTLPATWSGALEPPLVAERSFQGAASCASASCHGNADSRDPQVWKRSYWLWSRQDRHRRAFEVLFAPRSVAMVERLAATDRASSGEQTPASVTADASTYLRQLEDRCIGCHATAPPSTGAVAVATAPAATRRLAQDYADGVSCESCHGAAADWLTPHWSLDWKDLSAAQRLSGFGFAPTRALASRPAGCVDCHVGPKVVQGRSYEVDHDLIAAGHPRLDFEFSAALANLPPHWDATRDRDRHARETGSREFHFDAWKYGQIQTARSQLKLRDGDLARQAGLDFARYDCFACHHRLFGDAARAPVPGARRANPLDTGSAWRGVEAIFRATRGEPAAAPVAGGTLDPALRTWLEEAAAPARGASGEPATAPHLLRQFAEALRAPQTRSWDSVVGFNLALRAWLADVDPAGKSPLATEVVRFEAWLDGRFDVPAPNRYHSPVLFRPADPVLGEFLQSLQRGISQLEARP